MKKRDYITAGAYYRLSKRVLMEACVQISDSLHLQKAQSEKMWKCYNKWHLIETAIGFENKAYKDKVDEDILSLFYGDLRIFTETDKKVAVKMKEILQSLIDKIEKGEQEWTS